MNGFFVLHVQAGQKINTMNNSSNFLVLLWGGCTSSTTWTAIDMHPVAKLSSLPKCSLPVSCRLCGCCCSLVKTSLLILGIFVSIGRLEQVTILYTSRVVLSSRGHRINNTNQPSSQCLLEHTRLGRIPSPDPVRTHKLLTVLMRYSVTQSCQYCWCCRCSQPLLRSAFLGGEGVGSVNLFAKGHEQQLQGFAYL